jgi:D-3-phosphoglycerate dehydrogenase / 2-oxoglutarate reductase
VAKKILLLENIHPKTKSSFEEQGFQVDLKATAYSEDDLIKCIGDYEMVGIRSKTKITAKVLQRAEQLRAIGCFCIGTNQVDLDVAAQKGIPVFNAPYSNTRSVAELVIAEIVALSRNLCDLSRQVHDGTWNKSASGSREVRGKVLGIIGYGHIGSQVSILAEAMGLEVYFYDVTKKLPLGNAKSAPSLEFLLNKSDFVTLHVPETSETKNMIGKNELAQLKAGAYLINASRGTVVVLEELVPLLKNKKIAGAAIDVFPSEPKNNDEKFISDLQGLSNVILTPHIGGSTEEAQEAIGLEVTHSLLGYYTQGKSYGAVGFPSIEVPEKRPELIRVTNVHKNVPGVLGDINSIVSDMGANIRAQYLSTNEYIGYLVMDIESAQHAKDVAKKITNLKTAIKTFVL